MRSNTLLHDYVRDCKSVDEFKKKMGTLDKQEVTQMSGQLNDDGHTPYLLAYIHHFGSERYQPICNLLLPFILENTNQSLPKSLELPKEFYETKDSSLKAHFKIAYNAIVYARSIIKHSSTHPSINSFDPNKKKMLDTLCQLLKKKREAELIKKFESPQPKFDSAIKLNEYVSLFEKSAKTSEHGNCEEFSYLVFSYVSKQSPRLCQKIQTLVNGDHYFNIIGEGKSAVLCDAWLGILCPAADLPTTLKDFRYIEENDTFYNCLVPFNPKYHKIQTILTNDLLIPPLFQRRSDRHNPLLENKVHKGIVSGRRLI